MVAVGKGATLEAIHWYIAERRKYNDHGQMAAEFPSDDVEAFVHSGARVFDKYKVDAMRKTCKKPKYVGEVCADADEGKNALQNLRFVKDKQGLLHIGSCRKQMKRKLLQIVTSRLSMWVDVPIKQTSLLFLCLTVCL